MTPDPTRRTAAQLLACFTAALITATAVPSASAAPTDPAGPSAPPPPVSLDPHDGDLQLPAGSTLAQPKVLRLDQRRLPLTQLVAPTAPTVAASPSPRPFPPRQTGSTPSGQRTPPAATASPSASASPTAPATDQPAAPTYRRPSLHTVLGLVALLAAAVTGLFTARIWLRRRRAARATTTTTAHTPMTGAQPAADAAADGADTTGVARLDTALRTLAHHLTHSGERELPPLRAARLTPDTVAVLPDDPRHAPQPPFTAGHHGWWELDAGAALLEEETAHTVLAPYPALTALGTTPTDTDGPDALLLIDLARPPALLLDGDPPQITEVLTALALELITSPWSADTALVTIGFGEDLPQLTPSPRVTYLPQAADALREMSQRLLEARQMPHPHYRPHLLMSAHPLPADLVADLTALIDKAAPLPLTLIAPAHTATPLLPHAPVLNASLHKPQHIDYLDTAVTVQRLTPTAYQRITAALRTGTSSVPQDPHRADPLPRHTPRPAPLVPHHSIGPALQTDSMPRSGPAAPEEQTAGPAPLPAPTSSVRGTGPDRGHAAQSTHGNEPQSERSHEDDEVFPALRAAASQPVPPPPTAFRTSTTIKDDARPCRPTALRARTASAPHAGNEGTATTDAPSSRQCTAPDQDQHTHGPEIRVLGPVEVTGVHPSGHGPRIAQLAALLYFKPGRSADEVCADMDPANPWTLSTLNARLHGLRRALGDDPTGQPYVPRRTSADTPYHLSPHIRCDWTRFLHLTQTAQNLGPDGLPELEEALALVRGTPFGPRCLPWAEPYQQEMITRIVETAHTVATHRTPTGPHHDLSAAREAVATALDVDDTAEILYRDWMKIEAAASNRPGLHTVISRLQQVTRALNCPLEPETEHLVGQLLNTTPTRHTPTR
ncbi:hypothetical protein DKG34_37805 [Streptomyces sp. NWU49]|uniref:AfsR/SARP family transcriptional regulator n=1 Tax=Streptomyces sp. NWU49 TaxID=2201153 RepID=UPI000D67E456|nr:bacterial transcriptional activator domain-containing protein [Streptomyces sp. NWU49]PWJ02564.1 hypothetical protein DKG34_37805 [Streptomyces sp. NWU49]